MFLPVTDTSFCLVTDSVIDWRSDKPMNAEGNSQANQRASSDLWSSSLLCLVSFYVPANSSHLFSLFSLHDVSGTSKKISHSQPALLSVMSASSSLNDFLPPMTDWYLLSSTTRLKRLNDTQKEEKKMQRISTWSLQELYWFWMTLWRPSLFFEILLRFSVYVSIVHNASAFKTTRDSWGE